MNDCDMLDRIELSHRCGEAFEWDKWCIEIPYLQFPNDWKVKAVPPFQGAVIRYRITKEGLNRFVSVYLDCYDWLGCVNKPYWEIYESANGDCERFLMNDTKELLNAIQRALDA